MSEIEPKKAKFAPKHKVKENGDSSSDAMNIVTTNVNISAVKPKDTKPKFQRLSKGSKSSKSRENIERVPFYIPIAEKKPTKGKSKEIAANDKEEIKEPPQEAGKKTKAGKKGAPSSPHEEDSASIIDVTVNEEQGGVKYNMEISDEFDLYVTSDEEDVDVEMNTNDDSTEEWPRKRYAHNQKPLMLPIGPRTLASRSKDLQQSIIDPFSDKEELLLMQLPSEMAMLPQTIVGGEEGPGKESGQPFPSGKIGKMQVMESGKVLLITESGVKYDVSNGMPCYFLQCLAVMAVPKVWEEESVLSSSQPCGGEFGVVGTLKRKLVISQSEASIGLEEGIENVLSASL